MKTHHPRKKKPKSFPSIIRLAGTPEEWANIPLKIVRSIRTDKLPRLKRIHQSISNAANLLMPPVEIVPWGWTNTDNKGMVYGRCQLLRIDEAYQFGAEISVAALLFADNDLLLRRILIHEFSHCFWYYEHVLLDLAEGRRELRVTTPTDLSIEEFYELSKSGGDEEKSVNPFEWFSKQDAKQYLGYDEPVLNPSTFAFLRHWVNEGLPTKTPDLAMDSQDQIGIPEAIIRHVRKLRGEAVKGLEQVFGPPED